MSNTRLAFTSMVIILIIAGGTHVFHNPNILNLKSSESTHQLESPKNQSNPESSKQSLLKSEPQNTLPNEVPTNKNESLIGHWEIEWNEDGFKGSAIYSLEWKENKLIGTAILLRDEKGQAVQDNTKVFELVEFTNPCGKGIYSIEYDNENNEVPVDLCLKTPLTLSITYDYYGYRGEEIWKKIK